MLTLQNSVAWRNWETEEGKLLAKRDELGLHVWGIGKEASEGDIEQCVGWAVEVILRGLRTGEEHKMIR